MKISPVVGATEEMQGKGSRRNVFPLLFRLYNVSYTDIPSIPVFYSKVNGISRTYATNVAFL